jgi:protein-disulfide isomerase
MSKRFWIILGAIAVVIIGYLFLQGGSNQNGGTQANTDDATRHVLGNEESDITLLEYADYQCPFCALFHPVTKQVIEKYQDDIAFQYRHLPLPSHQNARAAARAAEAAGEQGKFWEMTDLLYQNQQSWSESGNARTLFEQYAQQLELDLEKFKEVFSSSAINSRINADIALFNETGESMSTPSFFLNGERLALNIPEGVENPGAHLLEEFSKYIDEAIESADNQ